MVKVDTSRADDTGRRDLQIVSDRPPGRLILEVPFTTRNTISYGLLVYARQTRRWVLIRRKHSIEFLLIIRGLYRPSHLPLLISMVTEEEAETLRCCIDSVTHFENIYSRMTSSNRDEWHYARLRFRESRDRLRSLLSGTQSTRPTLEWTWPKGRLQRGNVYETPFQCAIREFQEEVEVELPQPVYISSGYITEIIKTVIGRVIESRYWIYIVEEEIPIAVPHDHPEVSERYWLSTEEVIDNLQDASIMTRVLPIIQGL